MFRLVNFVTAAALALVAGIAGAACADKDEARLPEPAQQLERLFVVERELGRVAVLEKGALAREVPELGNLNHATVKFHRGAAYVVSRDGLLSKLDLATLGLVRQVKVGASGIGIDFVTTQRGDFIVVANYDPHDVVVLDLELEIVKRIATGSRNAGIKSHGAHVVFSLMDTDEIWVLNGDDDFAVVKRLSQTGQMPFDALLAGGAYVAGFFKEPSLGHLDLRTLTYSKRRLTEDGKELVLKVPHFGTWGVTTPNRDRVFVPAVGAKQLHKVDLGRFAYLGAVPLEGTPVFAVSSPDGRTLAVNYSGERENFVTIVDTESGRVLRELEVGKRVMHMRYSVSGKLLHVSSYFDDAVRTLRTSDWSVVNEVTVPEPSGIFVAPEVTP